MDSLASWVLWQVRVMLAAGIVFSLWLGCRRAAAIHRRHAILRRIRQRVPMRPSDTPI